MAKPAKLRRLAAAELAQLKKVTRLFLWRLGEIMKDSQVSTVFRWLLYSYSVSWIGCVVQDYPNLSHFKCRNQCSNYVKAHVSSPSLFPISQALQSWNWKYQDVLSLISWHRMSNIVRILEASLAVLRLPDPYLELLNCLGMELYGTKLYIDLALHPATPRP